MYPLTGRNSPLLFRRALRGFSRLLSDPGVPDPQIEYLLCHDTILISAADRTAVVQNQRRFVVYAPVRSIIINNPFFRGESSEASIDAPTACAAVNGEFVKIRTYNNDVDTDDVAFTVDFEFQPNLEYEVFSVAQYKDLRPFSQDRKLMREGLPMTIQPHRLCFVPRAPIRDLFLDIFFLDVNLPQPPGVRIWDPMSSIYIGTKGMRHRSILDNHFFWQSPDPLVGRRYEVSWSMPDRLALVQMGIALGPQNIPGNMGILSTFFQRAYLYGPHAILEARQKLMDIVQSAKERLVIIDPYMDNSVCDILHNVQNGIEVVLVTRDTSARHIDRSELQRLFKARDVMAWEIKNTWDIHDRFVIVDDVKMFSLGTSIKDLATKVCLLYKLPDGDLFTAAIIDKAYLYCGISRGTAKV